MTSAEIRKKYLAFFASKGHAVIPSASLLPDNDPTTLFIGSGMQPLIPYLLGQKHPSGNRLVNSQKSFRAEDIDEVGDNRHTTFFEMLGNWSLGDYFKQEQLPWFFEFLTKEVGLDPQKLYVSVYIGDKKNGVPKDDESVAIWKKLFKEKGIDAKDAEMDTEENAAKLGMKPGERIFYYSKKNWWSRAGAPEKMPANEPGGPDSEVFYEFSHIQHDKKFGELCHPNCDCGRYLEVGNSVFMEYKKTDKGTFEKLSQRNVDFGGGLERIAAVSIDSPDVFAIDIFKGAIGELEKLSGKKYSDPLYQKSFRVIADHLRACVHLIGDGAAPSNSDQGYFVRRFLRRAVRHADILGVKSESLPLIADSILEFYKDAYPATYAKRASIKEEISRETEKFAKTLEQGVREFEKLAKAAADSKNISGIDAFTLFSSYGFPIDMTIELAQAKGLKVDRESFDAEFKKHQDLSRAGAEQKFKGGLGDHSEVSLRYHTATHLLHQALRDVLGPEVGQKGSNITPERLRFDFAFPRKMTDDEKKKVEEIVNSKIQAALPVTRVELPKADAEKTGALHFFGDKYGDVVSVYYMGDSMDSAYSKEFCGGPHVTNTKELGSFKIQKEEAVSAGVRRIKAVLS